MSEFNVENAWEQADTLYHDGKRAESQKLLEQICRTDVESDQAEAIRSKELAVYRLAELLSIAKDHGKLVQLLRSIRSFFAVLPKAKTTKMVRKLFDNILSAGASVEEQHAICCEMIEWAKAEKRTFLRHRMEHRLAKVLFDKNECLEALQTINNLLREIRRLDDKSLLVDVHLLESCVYYRVKNISKARAALVSARTNANAIYCSPQSQAEIDMQSGVLCAEEKDAKTAFSYLYEAFEGFHSLGDHARSARQALIYMLLSKIVTDSPDELKAILQTKSVMQYTGPDIDALHGLASAWQKKDTHSFTKVLNEHAKDFGEDPIVSSQISDMHNTLVEKHLLRVIEPYTRVQLSYIADLLKLPQEDVESRISQLILDDRLHGIVDQQRNCLVVFEAADKASKDAHQEFFESGLEALANLDKLVTTIFDKVAGKFDKLAEEHVKKSKDSAASKADSKKKNDAESKADSKKTEAKK